MAAPLSPGVRSRVEVDGAKLSDELEVLIEEVLVDHHLHMPDMFLLIFRDRSYDVIGRLGVEIGSRVKISAPRPGSSSLELLIDGEVTALEADYSESGSRAVVRGYDGSHRLHRGRATDTYRNVKDSDLARKIAQQVNLEVGTIDDSPVTHEHVSQINLSYWEFLTQRAAEIGFEVSVTEGKLHFRKPTPASEAPADGTLQSSTALQLVFGTDLLTFRPRVTSAEQVNEVKVRSWDPRQKEALIGSAPAGTVGSKLTATPETMAAAFSNPGYLAFGVEAQQSEVDAAAKAIAEQIGSSVAEADGVARGNPVLKPGTAVSVGVVGDDFAGRYTLTHTRHVFNSRGYRTEFEVSGQQDRSLLGLVSRGRPSGSRPGGAPPFHGSVIGVVTNNDDPDRLGRVKVKLPWLSDTYESDWVRMLQMGAGPDSGACFLPEVNDEVLLIFEFGDVRRPIVIGGLHNGKDKPRLGAGLVDNGKVKRRGIVSRKGHRIVLFDDDSKSGIALVSSNGNLRIALNETKNEIHLYCQGKVRLEAQGDLTLSSQQNVSIEASSRLQLKGTAVEVSGQPIKLN